MTLWASAAVEQDRTTTPSTIAAPVANRKNGYSMLSSGRFVSAPAKPSFWDSDHAISYPIPGRCGDPDLAGLCRLQARTHLRRLTPSRYACSTWTGTRCITRSGATVRVEANNSGTARANVDQSAAPNSDQPFKICLPRADVLDLTCLTAASAQSWEQRLRKSSAKLAVGEGVSLISVTALG
jgi:hypothetical protein